MTQNTGESQDILSHPGRQAGENERLMGTHGCACGGLCVSCYPEPFNIGWLFELWVMLNGFDPLFVFFPRIALGI